MKRIALFAGLSLVALAAVARADDAAPTEVDIATLTCKYLTSASKDEAGTLLIWLHGYYGGKNDETTLNFADFGKAAEQVGLYCSDHPDASIMTAAKTAWSEK